MSRPRHKDGLIEAAGNSSVESRDTPESEKKREKERRKSEEGYAKRTPETNGEPRQVLDSTRVSLFVVPFKFSSVRHVAWVLQAAFKLVSAADRVGC